MSLAQDHSQRRSFPDSWTLSWCSEDRETRIGAAAAFGIPRSNLDQVIAWADEAFGSAFGAWNVAATYLALGGEEGGGGPRAARRRRAR